MINEIFISKWDPVVPLSLMTQAQKDNELERIHASMGGSCTGPKIDPDREFDRGFKDGIALSYSFVANARDCIEGIWLDGYDKG